jgi:hypothetical protein
MSITNNLYTVVSGYCKDYPELKNMFMDLYQVALDEIEDGANPSEEANLCIQIIKQIIADK